MNPEFQRNLWLELTPGRLIFMPTVLALVFAAVLVSTPLDARWEAIESVATFFFYAIALLWGTRSAASSILEEIRDRTWDFQRLSALAPWTMVWGKLFGATVYQWFGGLLCLAIIGLALSQTPGSNLQSIAFHVTVLFLIAVLAQSVSLLASLIGMRRRPGHSRFDIFAYQAIGLVTAFSVLSTWQPFQWAYTDRGRGLPDDLQWLAELRWFGLPVDALDLFLLTLGLLVFWALIGCHQMMRSALRVRNGPLVWTAFVTFLVLYTCGFIAPSESVWAWWSNDRLPAVFLISVALTYVMVVLEPKDIVDFRWLFTQVKSGHFGRAFWRLPSWALSSTFAIQALIVTLIVGRGMVWPFENGEVNLVALLGFMARDVGIFIFFAVGTRSMRGDFGAIVTLLILYAVLPIILGQIVSQNLLALFFPLAGDNAILSILSAFLQAGAVWFLTSRQLSAQIIRNPS